jgi:excisionase family DNA binding protein
MERLTYTVAEVAQALGVSRSKAYTLVAEGAIPIVALPGRRKLVARATLEQLLGTGTSSTRAESRTTPSDQPILAHDTRPESPTHHTENNRHPTPPSTTNHPAIPHQTVAPGVRGSDQARREPSR